jgi:hypothetical protein
LVQGNRLIPAETDQANGLRQDPLKLAQRQGSSSLEPTKSPFSRPPPVGPFTPVEVYFIGAEEPWVEPEGDPETMAILATAADAKTIMTDLEELAAKGDQSAKDYLAAKTAAAM